MASPTTEQAPLDPMGLVAGGRLIHPITAPHGAWRQLEMADAHWPSAIKQLGGRDWLGAASRGKAEGVLAMHNPV